MKSISIDPNGNSLHLLYKSSKGEWVTAADATASQREVMEATAKAFEASTGCETLLVTLAGTDLR